jgi:hypothetical protein
MTATLWFIYALTAVLGLVPGGIMGSAWAVATGETPRIGILHRLDYLTPVKIIAVCIYAPLGLVRAAFWSSEFNPVFAIILLAIGLGWSFLEGVFILTTFFGFT